MFCTQCANEVEAHAKFCSKCGTALAPARAEQRSSLHDMNIHVTVLGWIYVGSAILMGITGMMVVFASQLVIRLPIPWPPEVPPGVVPFIGSMVVFAGLMILAISAGVAAAGVGLLQYRNWGRVLAVILAVFLLFKFPIGTAISIYTFWVLFSDAGRNHYKSRSALANT